MALETTRAPAVVATPQLLRFATAGSVDDGKSTLIGRLLYDSKALMADQVADAELDLARLTDGLRAEREQGITIDVAYRHFSTPRRRFIIADTPGHAQYTRNMVTGASTADVAVVLVDAREGLLTQSRRHAVIAGLLRIPRVVLAVNKMDLVGYDADIFRSICADFRAWAARLEFAGEARAYAGRLAGGTVRAGDEVVVLPSGLTTRVVEVEGPGGPLEAAAAPLSVAVTLEDEVDAGRGALLCGVNGRPRATRDVEATVCWLGESPGRVGGRYLLKHTTRTERVRLEIVRETLDVATLSSHPGADSLGLNDIARVSLRCASELVFDSYVDNRSTGAFILIDSATNDTVGAGMIR